MPSTEVGSDATKFWEAISVYSSIGANRKPQFVHLLRTLSNVQRYPWRWHPHEKG